MDSHMHYSCVWLHSCYFHCSHWGNFRNVLLNIILFGWIIYAMTFRWLITYVECIIYSVVFLKCPVQSMINVTRCFHTLWSLSREKENCSGFSSVSCNTFSSLSPFHATLQGFWPFLWQKQSEEDFGSNQLELPYYSMMLIPRNMLQSDSHPHIT